MNLTVASRFYRQKFSERPFVSADSNYFFHNEEFLLNEVVLTKRKYLKSTMIQTFGITEDIPIGYLFKFLGGYEFGEFYDQPYFGVEAAAGRYLSGVGYISGQAGVGGFVENAGLEQGVFSLKGLYFSPLIKIQRNHFRQFFNINYSTVINPVVDEPFGFQGDIRGISEEVQGDRKFSVSSESVLFHPLKLYGFRLASYAFYDFGWIGFDDSILSSENFYSSVGLGIRLRNESLIFRTIQMRFGYITDQGFSFSLSFSTPRIFSTFEAGKPDVIKF